MENEEKDLEQAQVTQETPPVPPEEPAAAPEEDGKESKKEKKAAKKEAKALQEELETTRAQLKQVQEEFAAHKQQYLRVLAEYDNFRKRSEREKNASFGNGMAEAVGKILPVADNLERALAQEAGTLEQLKEGLVMVNRQLGSALEQLGVKEMGTVGEQFDPTRHNAVSHIENDELGENEISAVYQKGYTLGDRVIRHAMVQVAN